MDEATWWNKDRVDIRALRKDFLPMHTCNNRNKNQITGRRQRLKCSSFSSVCREWQIWNELKEKVKCHSLSVFKNKSSSTNVLTNNTFIKNFIQGLPDWCSDVSILFYVVTMEGGTVWSTLQAESGFTITAHVGNIANKRTDDVEIKNY